jgi:hypothetical protein
MRKNLFYFVLAAVSLVITLSSCSKDNGDGNDVDYAAQIAKSYPGNLIVAGGIPTQYTMDISRSGINLIKLELKNLSYMGMVNMGDIILDNLALTKNGNDSIRFSAKNKPVNVEGVSVEIDVDGATLNGTLVVNMRIKGITDEPIPVYFTTEPVSGNVVAEGGEIWTAMDGIYNGILNPGDMDKNVTVTKTGNYDIMITIPSVSFNPLMPLMDISVPATVTENPDGTCSFTGIIPLVGGPLTGTAMSVGNITFTASALGYTIDYTGSK